MQKEYGVDSSDAIDLLAIFDGLSCSCGWTANRGIFSAIAEFDLKLLMFPINVVVVHSVHSLKNAKKSAKFSTAEYFYALIKHERKSSWTQRPESSLQVSKLFHGFLTEKRNFLSLWFGMKSGIFISLPKNSNGMLCETVKLFLYLWLQFVWIDWWNDSKPGYKWHNLRSIK